MKLSKPRVYYYLSLARKAMFPSIDNIPALKKEEAKVFSPTPNTSRLRIA